MTDIERQLLAALEEVTDAFKLCMIIDDSYPVYAEIRIKNARSVIAKAKGGKDG